MVLEKFNLENKYTSLYLVEQINLFRSQESNKARLAHFSLLSKIEKEFEDEINDKNIFAVDYMDQKGEMRKCYELNFEQSLQLLMSESKTVRKGVVEVLKSQQKEINELKSQLPDFSNPVLAARAWADEVEAKQLAQSQVKELTPKAEIADRINSGQNNITMNDAAKIIGIGRNTLMSQLREKNILRKNNTPYQQYIDIEYFVVKVTPIKNGENPFNVAQTYVTAKGLTWLAGKF